MMMRLLAFCCALLPALAVELDDVRAGLTRKQADALEGPYDYQVMSDLSVRRTWIREDLGYKLSMDFDTRTDKLICATLVYAQPASREQAVADAERMGHASGTKWTRLNDDKVEKYGFYHAFCARLEGGAMLFRETGSSGKTERIVYYSSTPKENRRHMEEWGDDGHTAMGRRATASKGGREIVQDEQRRLEMREANNFAPLSEADETALAARASKSADASSRPTQGSRPVRREAAPDKKMETQRDPNSRLGRLESLFIDIVGRPVCQQDYLVAGGVLVVVVLIGMVTTLSSRARDRRMQRQYERMMVGGNNAGQALRGKILASQHRITKRRR